MGYLPTCKNADGKEIFAPITGYFIHHLPLPLPSNSPLVCSSHPANYHLLFPSGDTGAVFCIQKLLKAKPWLTHPQGKAQSLGLITVCSIHGKLDCKMPDILATGPPTETTQMQKKSIPI